MSNQGKATTKVHTSEAMSLLVLFTRGRLKDTYRKMEDPKAGASLKTPPQHRNDLQRLEPWSSLHD